MTTGLIKKTLPVLVLSLFSLSTIAATIINGKLTKEALFDPKIPIATLSRDIKASGLNVKAAIAGAIRMKPGTHFTTVGSIAEFDYVPVAYRNTHAIVYYIPKSLKDSLYGKTPDVGPVLVILHGGGEGTAAYGAARSAAYRYIDDFIQFAEEHKTILIAPSTSIGWNALANTFLLREINTLARKELNVSGNRFYLFGHSMGAMGMTRSTSNLVDEFAGFLAAAGGMEDYARNETGLRPYLNTNFTHINGLQDHFEVFKPRLEDTQRQMKELALKEKMPLTFKAIFHPGGHNYDLGLTFSELKKLFQTPRKLYQPRVFGYMGKAYQAPGTPMPVQDFSYPHSFWARALEFADPQAEGKSLYTHWNFELVQNNNAIEITGVSGTQNLKKLRLYVHDKSLDLGRLVKIYVNGKLVSEKSLRPDPLKTLEIVRARGDQQFLFDQSVDLQFK